MRNQASELKLIAHHVGARGYGVSFTVPEPFRAEITHVLYEADAESVQRMTQQTGSAHARLLAEKYILPYCLGRKRSRALLNITANAYASSIFPPDRDFLRFYHEISIDAAIYDVIYADMLEVVRKVEVEVYALDELFAEGRIPVATQPDFLSLDTQGYELEILEGAKATISKGVLGIISEVEMVPMYSGQPLFADILKFMTEHGFFFAGFTAQHEISSHRAPVGLRGKAFPGFGDALFLRKLSTLTEERVPVDALYVMLLKLAFIAVCFSYVEYALEAVSLARRHRNGATPALLSAAAKLKYVQFLNEMEKVASDHEGVFPPIHAVPDDSRQAGDPRTSWYDKYHQLALKRFANASKPQPQSSESVEASRLRGSWLARAARRALPICVKSVLRRMLLSKPVGAMPAFPGTASTPLDGTADFTDFEKLLNNWGFAGPAYLVRQRRRSTEGYVRSLDSEMYDAGSKAHLSRS